MKRRIAEIEPNVILLSDVYVDNKTPMQFQCSCGKKFSKTLDTIQTKKSCKCRSCARKYGWENNRRPINFEQESSKVYLEKGYTPLEKIRNAKDKVLCEDSLGYRGKISLENVKLGKHFSIFSLRYNKENLIFNLQNFANLNNADVIVLSFEDSEKTCTAKIKCKCSCGEEFYSNLGDFIENKHWRCSKCSKVKSILEILAEEELLKYTDNVVTQKRFQDCINDKTGYMLPFDFYLPELNTCVEIDGEQHSRPSKFASITDAEAEEKLKERKRLDSIKNKYCKNHNIDLVRISYKRFDKQNKYKEDIKNIFS